jgi:hypothetical protein
MAKPLSNREVSHKINDDIRDAIIERAFHQKRLDKQVVNKRVATAVGREMVFLDELESALKRVFKPRYTTSTIYKGKKARHTERLVHVIISDTHFHSLLDPEECPRQYGPVEESRRFGKVIAQAAEYKRQYRHETKLRIKLLGDLFQNQLHDQREGAPLALQFAATLHYLIQGVSFLASEYQEVQVDCASGNHGRNKQRHMDRAVQQKWDSIETMVYFALQTACKAAKLSNVTINIPKTPYIVETCFEQKAFWTHGDTVLKPGYPGRAIDVGGLYQQVCRFNAAKHINGPFSMFGVGHVHFGSITNMPGCISMLTNGCLIPPDAFALSIGAPEVTCGQYIFESVRGHICGDQRFVRVDDADTEPSYNEIIEPFHGKL